MSGTAIEYEQVIKRDGYLLRVWSTYSTRHTSPDKPYRFSITSPSGELFTFRGDHHRTASPSDAWVKVRMMLRRIKAGHKVYSRGI